MNVKANELLNNFSKLIFFFKKNIKNSSIK